MKRLKIILSSLILTAGCIIFLSFVAHHFDKDAFRTVCYYFRPASIKQRITGTGADYLVSTELTKTSNWKGVSIIPPLDFNGGDCENGSFFCAICFDDSRYTLAQAIDKAREYY